MSEPELPGIPPPPKPSWYKRLFARWKLPGWAALGLGGLPLPLRIFRLGEDIDFAIIMIRAIGGELGLAVSILASPLFSLGLISYGVLHLIFVGEPRQTLRSRVWTYIGWSIFGICLTAMVTAAVWGLVQISIQKAVSTKDQELQRQFTARPQFWHLTDYNKSALAAALARIPEADRFEIKIQCLPDATSRTFVEDLGNIILKQNWKANANCFFSRLRPDFQGIAIGVAAEWQGKSADDLPANPRTLAKILNEAQIPFDLIASDIVEGKDTVMLIVGNGPKP
jgi:hypothetical protein